MVAQTVVALYLVVALPLILAHSANSALSETQELTGPQKKELQEILKTSLPDLYIPPEAWNWNPAFYPGSEFYFRFCLANIPGNYPYLPDPTKFVMCFGGIIFLWTCPAGMIFLPTYNGCVYWQLAYLWASVWFSSPAPTCKNKGQCQWKDTRLTFPGGITESYDPFDKKLICQPKIVYCNNFVDVGGEVCPSGFVYSRPLFGCVQFELCFAIEALFPIYRNNTEEIPYKEIATIFEKAEHLIDSTAVLPLSVNNDNTNQNLARFLRKNNFKIKARNEPLNNIIKSKSSISPN